MLARPFAACEERYRWRGSLRGSASRPRSRSTTPGRIGGRSGRSSSASGAEGLPPPLAWVIWAVRARFAHTAARRLESASAGSCCRKCTNCGTLRRGGCRTATRSPCPDLFSLAPPTDLSTMSSPASPEARPDRSLDDDSSHAYRERRSASFYPPCPLAGRVQGRHWAAFAFCTRHQRLHRRLQPVLRLLERVAESVARFRGPAHVDLRPDGNEWVVTLSPAAHGGRYPRLRL